MLRSPGYTLLELLTTLAVAAVLVAVAVPTFRTVVLDARLTAAVNRVVHGMHVARQEAFKYGEDVVICRSRTGRQCAHTGTWDAGLIVFVNRDQDDPARVDPGETILQVEPGLASGPVLANRRAFVFRPSGLRSVNGTLTFCDRRGRAASRAVVVSYTGRPRAASALAADGAMRCPV